MHTLIAQQEPGILPGWMIGVPLLILVGLLVWLLIKGNHDEPVSEQADTFTDDDGYLMVPPAPGANDCEPTWSTDLKPGMQHNREATADDLREAVIALWNENGGWIPGAAYADLAYVLGVEVDRLTHYDPMLRQHHRGQG